jgi:hypothetical protein
MSAIFHALGAAVFSIAQPQSADWLDGWVIAPLVAGLG